MFGAGNSGLAVIRPYRDCCFTEDKVCLCYVLNIPGRPKVLNKPQSKKPLFYADKGRYEPHVIRAMTNLGFRQVIHCLRSETNRGRSWTETEALKVIKLLWLRNRAGFPYMQTRGGAHLWNHIPNEFVLTKKHYLAMNIRQYVKENGDEIPERYREIHPETFVLEVDHEREAFFEALKASEKKRALISSKSDSEKKTLDNTTLWIIKPVDSSGGKGIGVVGTFKEFAKDYLCENPAYVPRVSKATSSSSIDDLSESSLSYPKTIDEAMNSPDVANMCRSLIAQRYIASPLLLNGHKFDIRGYMYIADVNPPLVFYHDGYLRVNIEAYDTDNLDNKWAHISNIGLQKAHPEYEEKKESTKWSFKTWQAHMLKAGLTTDPDWISNVIKPQLKKIMEIAYRSVLTKVDKWGGHGCFALLGVDFLIDSDHRAWLLEYTKTPAGHSTLEKDDTLFADMMDELLQLQVELSGKSAGLKSYPEDFHLDSLKDFVRIV